MTAGATWSFEAIGTAWRIDTAEAVPETLRRRVRDRIERYDQAFSRFRDDSLVSGHARRGGTLTYPDEAAELFALYLRLADLTGGRVSPLIGGSLERLGYDAEYSLPPAGDPIPAPPLRPMLEVDDNVVRLREPALLDVGAAGKGQLVDLVTEVLRSGGAGAVTVDAGGDIRHEGQAPLAVALEHPHDPTSAIGVVRLGGGRAAIAASAGNRRAWGNGGHHILDGLTGRPVRTVVATWALTSRAMTADGLATALFFVPGEALAEEFDLDWVRVLADGTAEASSTLPGEVFLR
jgi:FAD:protein FMN transferase